MTNVHLPKPSNAQLQRATFSSYYNENCFKVAIGLQLCRFIRTHNLWTGWVSDSTYQEKSGIFKKQSEFAKTDLVGVQKKFIAFMNILDKGYQN